MIKTPYLLFLGDAPDALSAKVAQGIKDWSPDVAVGQFRMEGCQADMGLDDIDIDAAVAAGVKTLVIGVANRGGYISDAWKGVLIEALEKGLDLASGLHNLLRDEADLVAVAEKHGRTLHDVRVPSVDYPIASGVRATGQTGILIEGDGVPLDAVIADFMAGSIEWLTPDNDADHWDMIEGQGSLFHVSYSGVTMALVHGGQPDALILCHEPTRPHMRGLPDYRVRSLAELRDMALPLARVGNPDCEVVGISVNTQHMSEEDANSYLAEVEAEMGLPTVDPFRHGAKRLVDALA